MTPFAKRVRDSAATLGEEKLISRIRVWLGAAAPRPPAGPGDDCAVVRVRGCTHLVVTTDPVVLGRHFDESTPPATVARKLLRRNLSDIAAMGGTPQFATLGWTVPERTRLGWLEAFHRALGRDALRYGVTINGGDISGGSDLAAHMTLFGTSNRRPLLRTGARIGDWIYVTGELGGSIFGRHAEFEPRLREGRWLAARKDVHCLIDVSDGIAKEVGLITPTGLRPSIRPESIPVSAAARRLSKRDGRSAIEHSLTDGEDFELLFASAPGVPSNRLEREWAKRFRTRLTRIGCFVSLDHPAGGGLDMSGLSGFEHLRKAPRG